MHPGFRVFYQLLGPGALCWDIQHIFLRRPPTSGRGLYRYDGQAAHGNPESLRHLDHSRRCPPMLYPRVCDRIGRVIHEVSRSAQSIRDTAQETARRDRCVTVAK